MVGLTASFAIRLRPVRADDWALLVRVYRSSREDELAATGWDDEVKAAFVEQQFTAQDKAYREAGPEAVFLVVERDGEGIGRLYLVDLPTEVRIADVALLPEHRGRGIGTALVEAVVREADESRRKVTLYVEPWNPARRLYERLGFLVVAQRGVYELMERAPAEDRSDQLKTAS